MPTDAGTRRFDFRFAPDMRPWSSLFGVRPASAFVEIGAELTVRFGLWRVRTPFDNVASAEITGPYSWVRTVGPARLSLADRGVTFATNRDAGVCIGFRHPLGIVVPGDLLRSPALTVTVADTDGLAEALRGIAA